MLRPQSREISAPAQPRRRFRGVWAKFLYVNVVLDLGPSDSGPLPLRARCPLPPLPNRLEPKLALVAARAGGSGLPIPPRWESGAPPLGQKATLPDSGWRTSGGLLGHFHTGRQCSSSLTFFNL